MISNNNMRGLPQFAECERRPSHNLSNCVHHRSVDTENDLTMFHLGSSRSPNVQNLGRNELIDLIKNDEYYSGCCRIIEEKNLGGIDILNLSENRLKTWRLPDWLSKKLISLREKLTKDPESFLSVEEENPDIDPKKNISSTLTTLFKNRQVPKLPVRKPPGESSVETSFKKEPNPDLPYDDENYLKPEFIKGPKEHKFDKPVLKFPNKRGQEVIPTPSRKPRALPRPDLDEEENGYEPPPSHSIKSRNSSLKPPLPLPPPPDEITDEYEELPQSFPTEISESSEDLHYEYIEAKEKESNGNLKKLSTAKFYIDSDFPPPLPERSATQKEEAKKWLTPPLYTNVNRAQSPSTNSSFEGKSGLPRQRRLSPTNISDTKKKDTKKTWSTLTRPLPPLPSAKEVQSSKPKASKREFEPQDEQVSYENHSQKKTPEAETLPEYLNTTESSNKPSKPSLISELKLRTSTQYPKERSNDFRSHSPNFKLNKTQTTKAISDDNYKKLKEKQQNERVNTFNAQSKKSQMKLPLPPMSLTIANDNFGNHIDLDDVNDNSEHQPEYGNTIETKTKHIARKAFQETHSPVSHFAHEITKIKLKPFTPQKELVNLEEQKWVAPDKSEQTDDNESDFEDDFDEPDDIPEYLNTSETEVPEPIVNKSRSSTQSIGSSLASQLSKVQLKSTSKNEIHVDNKVSNELRAKLRRRNGRIAEGETPVNSSHTINANNRDIPNYSTVEDQPEYGNTPETKPAVWRTQQEKPSPVNQFTQEISKKKLKPSMAQNKGINIPEKRWGVPEKPKPAWERHGTAGNNFENDDDEQDDLPEYLNTPESQEPESNVKRSGSNTQAIASSLASQLAHVQLKSTPKKDIHLDDKLADELRVLLLKRKGQNEKTTDGESHIHSYTPSKPLAIPPQNFNLASNENDNEEEDDEQENYDVAGSYNDLLNFNNEPFYRNTDRKGAILLLKDLEDGAFLLRPSRKYFLSITIKNKGKYFNLGIEKTSENKIFCGEVTMKSKEFYSLKTFLKHFEHSPLILRGENGLEEVYLKKVLPPERY